MRCTEPWCQSSIFCSILNSNRSHHMSQRKVLIKKVGEYANLYRDPESGIAWVEDGSTGMGHSAHPNIDASGSVSGMKRLGYWHWGDRTKRSHGFIYNIDSCLISDDYDRMAAEYCQCGGIHRR